MLEEKTDYGENIWESTITIKRKHFLNMVKKYYKDIMDEDVKVKCYPYIGCYDYGGIDDDINTGNDYYIAYKIKI